jgi:uncharacterized protein (TIGR01777 family)
MRVAITGSTGLIGRALTRSLLTDGHEVVRLVREASAPIAADSGRTSLWDPHGGWIQPGALDGVEAVVHLAGAGIGDRRWTTASKDLIRTSRIQGTRTIARASAAAPTPPRVLISASATGYYGDTGDRLTDESDPAGHDFLAGVCADWEAAADPARHAGIRVVHPRTGLVVSATGGAFGRLLPLFRLGLGGRLGSGDQYWPFISLTDHIAALRFAIDAPELSGPVNLTAPEPLTNREITRAMGRVLHRPTLAPVPAFVLRAAIGEFASAITCSARVVPGALLKAGFTFTQPAIDTALRSALQAD